MPSVRERSRRPAGLLLLVDDLVAKVDRLRRRDDRLIGNVDVARSTRRLENRLDLAPDELVAVDQRVTQSGDEVLVGLEPALDQHLLLLQHLLDLAATFAVAEHTADEVRVTECAAL